MIRIVSLSLLLLLAAPVAAVAQTESWACREAPFHPTPRVVLTHSPVEGPTSTVVIYDDQIYPARFFLNGPKLNWAFGPDARFRFEVRPDGTGAYYDTANPSGDLIFDTFYLDCRRFSP